MATNAPKQEHVQYVVVVHGMGDARAVETVLPVATRMAEVRAQWEWPPPQDVLTLGAAAGQMAREAPAGACLYVAPAPGGNGAGGCRYVAPPAAPPNPPGRPWMEFAEIPVTGLASGPFYGVAAARTTLGTNVRFVDIHWNDLLDEDFKLVGQNPNAWVDGLMGRLVRKDAYAVLSGGPGVPRWVLETLRSLGELVWLAHLAAKLKVKELDDLAFNQYLGDVQLYGEYSYTRRRAVRRFHERMEAVARAHAEAEASAVNEGVRVQAREARYVVVAHSLGTVMAMDALLTAHAAPPAGRPTLTSWIEDVTHFVTLGSPIDKFLVIWWLNYRYLLTTNWMVARRDKDKIKHWNFCEEQDPVGHHLDVAESSPAFKAAFKTEEDFVYVRYAIPGLAHVRYWNDPGLWAHIMDETIEPGPWGRTNPAWFDGWVYLAIVMITYVVVPAVVALAQFLALNWALGGKGVNEEVMGALGLLFAWLVGRHVIDLMVWWRQILRAKAG